MNLLKKQFILTAVLLFGLCISALNARPPLWIDSEEPPTLPEQVTEKQNIEAARASGFADYEIDYYHTMIAKILAGISPENIPEGPGNFNELTTAGTTRKMIRGKDASGKSYIRIRVREGRGYSTEIYPELFTYRVDCFLYPGANGLEKVMFQFARINHGKNHYVREIRRFIHPSPGKLPETPAVQPQGGTAQNPPASQGDNSVIYFEYFEQPSRVKPVWEGPDGVPMADLSIKSEYSFKLHDPAKPLHYYRQISVTRRYKFMLRSVLASLDSKIRSQDLERALIIEKIMDF